MKVRKIIITGADGEIMEKKSRFIGAIRYVSSEEEAIEFIKQRKKKYYDAKHNCSAYIIGENPPLIRVNDDSEPSNTAGKPILEVLEGEGLQNVVCVVTRYFGGVLLGTGGLVRAYQKATKEALRNTKMGILIKGVKLEVTSDYSDGEKIRYYAKSLGIDIKDIQYGVDVKMILQFPEAMVQMVGEEISKRTDGRAIINELQRADFVDKESMV